MSEFNFLFYDMIPADDKLTTHVCHGCFLGWHLTEKEAEEGCPICGFPLSTDVEA